MLFDCVQQGLIVGRDTWLPQVHPLRQFRRDGSDGQGDTEAHCLAGRGDRRKAVCAAGVALSASGQEYAGCNCQQAQNEFNQLRRRGRQTRSRVLESERKPVTRRASLAIARDQGDFFGA